jgi:hypothetical protein
VRAVSLRLSPPIVDALPMTLEAAFGDDDIFNPARLKGAVRLGARDAS